MPLVETLTAANLSRLVNDQMPPSRAAKLRGNFNYELACLTIFMHIVTVIVSAATERSRLLSSRLITNKTLVIIRVSQTLSESTMSAHDPLRTFASSPMCTSKIASVRRVQLWSGPSRSLAPKAELAGWTAAIGDPLPVRNQITAPLGQR